ncbi:hypothetical protein B0I33_101142 [Prauserella shujinwangii]|uniref:Uncharacterized protein n=1 Tax=Prauserella shujinwangii TaxID=1453103 RepID=A0A2T0M2P2_9PSEU|nr:hypothetical protein [Prauserella shujinwangii]PRX50990.1 hypothetical protein B0I33_101142 [Prauserella shujinwangii]
MSSAAGTVAGVPGDDSGFERIRAVADAILYEGYLLYPYRKSSPKNRVRWQFGVLAPRAWAERVGPVAESVAGSVESWRQHTECLVETRADPAGVVLRARVRYLQLQAKRVERRTADGGHEPVESLEYGGRPHLTFDEAVPREHDLVVTLAEILGGGRVFDVGAPGATDTEPLGDRGRVLRWRWPVAATATLAAERLDAPVPAFRLSLTTANTGSSAGPDTPRPEVLRHSLIAAHTLLRGEGLRFPSLIDPPAWAGSHARRCRNVHTFPVLAGDDAGPGTGTGMLSSPILLYDDPRVAPESPGDLHDAAEIDEILSLRTLTLTEDEKREARATDPRAAEILDRVHGMPEEVLARLHGAVRSLRPDPTVPREPTTNATDEGET